MRKFIDENIRIEFLKALEKSEGRELLGIDMDGPVCWFDLAAEQRSKTLGITTKEFTDRKLYREKNFYLELKPVSGALDAIKLLDKKYEIRFVPAPSWGCVHSFTEKRIWIEKYFGSWAEKKMDLTFRKDLFMGHYLIDDRFKYGVENFIGEHIHFGSEMFPDWNAVLKYLL